MGQTEKKEREIETLRSDLRVEVGQVQVKHSNSAAIDLRRCFLSHSLRSGGERAP
jgi:hypothetical protein